ncbi:sensor histidine kinase [Micromonospora sp. NBC_01699]|uniref:sensor histidine kinase n=1 Tax=Micromonospora sp. NBC_01699 TaxID=2975984 RepID=UPI002E286E81|nr:sensor histidine kinase [Micromonospora sp. NBC_01699]
MSVIAPAQLPGRGSARFRSWIVWGSCVLSPVLLFVWLNTGNPANWPFGLRLIVPILLMALPVAGLRRRPLVALAVMLLDVALVELPISTAVSDNESFHGALRTIQIVAVDVAVGFVAAGRRRWVSVTTAVLVLVLQLLVAVAFQLSPADLNERATQDVLAMVTAWMIGNSMRQRRLFAEAQRAEAEASAVRAERLRIARELHDMVAHCVGVVAMQAGMARRVLDTQPEETRKALVEIEQTGRETLAALRRMLGSLRRADASSGPAPLDPAPGLTDLGRLAKRSLDLGVQVEVRSSGEDRPLPADIDLSAYRIIQEAVTNVVRHADARHCEVVVDQRSDELSIQVIDDGRGGAVGAGYGIAGMRERVSLLGGEFDAGPRPEGGFRVAARIPLAPAR